jgi:hypothetical protein
MCILVKPTHDGPAHRRAKEFGDLAENEVLDQVQAVLGGVVLPEGFEAQFRNGPPGNRGLEFRGSVQFVLRRGQSY